MKKAQEKDQAAPRRQLDKFIETARAIGCDEDKERFEVQARQDRGAQAGKRAAEKIERIKDEGTRQIGGFFIGWK